MAKNKDSKKIKPGELFAEYPNLYEKASEDDLNATFQFAEEYKAFLDNSKTEREFAANAIAAAEDLGYVDIATKDTLKPGDKVYQSIKGKGFAAAVIGKKSPAEGFNILGAHIDSPRLDLKPNPIYEDNDTVYFKTHYYGGIKKYQWTTIPLAVHGVVFTNDGKAHQIVVGEKDTDPVFYITDLLPHLGNEQMTSVLKILFEQYGIKEKDFVSAEIEIVPATHARDVGFDRAYIAAYGHDDKVCAYPALRALLAQEKPKKTCVCLLTDKEEIGSYSNSGATSNLYENFLMEVFAKAEGGIDKFNTLKFRKALAATKMLSTDVTTAYDPKYSSVFEKNNTAFMSHGLKIEKYTGARGKSGCSEATGDFIAEITDIFEKNSIPWQTGELGRIDAGGGGTIAAIMAELGMDVVDMGVPVWSMHAPVEVISKIDLYYLYLGYKAFIENIG